MLLIDPSIPPHGATPAWLAVTAPDRLVIIRATGSTDDGDVVDALWDALGDSRGVERALDTLAARGIGRTPPFILVDWAPLPSDLHAVRVIVRGDPVVTVTSGDREHRFSGAGVSTWSEVLVEDAATLRAVVAPASGGRLLPLVSGAAWVCGVVWNRTPVPAAVPDPASRTQENKAQENKVQENQAEPHTRGGANIGHDTEETLVVDHTMRGADPEPAPRPTATTTPVPTSTPVPPTTSVPPTAPVPEEYDALFGATVMRSIEEAAVRSTTPDDQTGTPAIDPPGFVTDSLPSRPEPGDHDGMTVLTSDLAALCRSADDAEQVPAARSGAVETDFAETGAAAASGTTKTGAAAASADDDDASAAPAAAGHQLILPDGSVWQITGEVYLGRAPSARSIPGGSIPQLITVDSDEHDISRTHVRVAVEGDTVVVTDLHSRNGTRVLLPGRSPQRLRAGEPTAVISGTVVDLGSEVWFTVESA